MHCKSPDGSLTTLEEPGYIVVATGITANTKKLAVDNNGLQLTATGHIHVNAKMGTNLINIYVRSTCALLLPNSVYSYLPKSVHC